MTRRVVLTAEIVTHVEFMAAKRLQALTHWMMDNSGMDLPTARTQAKALLRKALLRKATG